MLGAAVLGTTPVRAQEGEPACDPEVDPGCETVVCDPELDPECGEQGGGGGSCDPAVDPECGEVCDPAVDPGCGEGGDGGEGSACDPVTGEGCEEQAIPPPDVSQIDPECVYSYDESGFGQCTHGDLHCEFQPFTDGSGLGLEACVLPEVVLGPDVVSVADESGGGATTGADETSRSGPDTLPQTGSNVRDLVLAGWTLVIAGAALTVATRGRRGDRHPI